MDMVGWETLGVDVGKEKQCWGRNRAELDGAEDS